MTNLTEKLTVMVLEWDAVESFNSSMDAHDMLDDFVRRMRAIVRDGPEADSVYGYTRDPVWFKANGYDAPTDLQWDKILRLCSNGIEALLVDTDLFEEAVASILKRKEASK